VTSDAQPTHGVRFLVRRPAYEVALRLDETPVEKCRFALFLSQSLDGEPIEYEAEGGATALAATDISITLDGDGALSAISAGESDKTHAFVKAAAEVAVSAAKPAGSIVDPEAPCRRLGQQDPRFQRYLDRHRDLAAQLANARDALEVRRRAVTGGTGTAKLRTIAALADLARELDTQLAGDRFELGEDQFNIAVGEKVVQPRKANATPWVEVLLTEEGSP
jgi:hypothetical protein